MKKVTNAFVILNKLCGKKLHDKIREKNLSRTSIKIIYSGSGKCLN